MYVLFFNETKIILNILIFSSTNNILDILLARANEKMTRFLFLIPKTPSIFGFLKKKFFFLKMKPKAEKYLLLYKGFNTDTTRYVFV